MDLVAMLPWWGGVLLAWLSYAILHHLSVPPSTAGLQPGQISSLMTRSVIAAFASIGQLIVPILCLFAALASFLRRQNGERLLTR
jgi:restriction system protein